MCTVSMLFDKNFLIQPWIISKIVIGILKHTIAYQIEKLRKLTLISVVLSTSWKGAGSTWHLLKSTNWLSCSSCHASCYKWGTTMLHLSKKYTAQTLHNGRLQQHRKKKGI